jgi:hypothetical protein
VESLQQVLATVFSSGLADWGLAVAFIAVCALFIARLQWRMRRAVVEAAPEDAARSEVELLPLPSREPENPATLGELQTQAAFQIDAAEHALNRLLAECAPVAAVPARPSVTPQRELAKPDEKPGRSSLAA